MDEFEFSDIERLRLLLLAPLCSLKDVSRSLDVLSWLPKRLMPLEELATDLECKFFNVKILDEKDGRCLWRKGDEGEEEEEDDDSVETERRGDEDEAATDEAR